MIEHLHTVRRRNGYVDQSSWNFLVDSAFFSAIRTTATPDTREPPAGSSEREFAPFDRSHSV
jgi:hypothetical protein